MSSHSVCRQSRHMYSNSADGARRETFGVGSRLEKLLRRKLSAPAHSSLVALIEVEKCFPTIDKACILSGKAFFSGVYFANPLFGDSSSTLSKEEWKNRRRPFSLQVLSTRYQRKKRETRRERVSGKY